MVVEGSIEENINEVRDIVNSKVEVESNLFEITDRANNKLRVDTKKGLVYREKNNEFVLCNTVEESEKQNGYLYVKLSIHDRNSNTKDINYGQHSLVAMIAYTDSYDMIAKDNTPVANHKNNCPWDNRAVNLEWTTQKWNTLHGKVINSLHRKQLYIKNMTKRTWTTIQHNQSKKDFVTLTEEQSISVKELEAYEHYVRANSKKKTLKSFWGIKEEHDYINEYDLVTFIKWLDKYRTSNSKKSTRTTGRGMSLINLLI